VKITKPIKMVEEYLFLIAGLIIGAIIVYFILNQSYEKMYQSRLEEWKLKNIPAQREDAVKKSQYVLKGKIGEQFAPLLPDFMAMCNPSDARFIGSPIDYVVFKNLTCEEGNELPVEIILVDVKTGKANLNKNQRKIQEAAVQKRISFQTIRIKEEIG
jgi:predicted Holliday junction resolvase-like endonuclease